MLREKEQINIMNKFAKLVSSGISAVRAMELSDFPEDAVMSVAQGNRLSDAMRPFFCKKAVSLVRLGEAGGDLGGASKAAHDSLLFIREQKSAFSKALAYPAFILVFGFVCILFFAWCIIPQLKTVFASMDIKPSFAVFFMEAFARFSVFSLFFVLTGLAILAFLSKNRDHRLRMEKAALTLPGVGTLFKKSGTVRALSDISTLLKAGMPLPEALGSAASCSDSGLFEGALFRVKELVEKGHKLSLAFGSEPLFGRFISDMALVGEESGDIASSLSSAAEIASEELKSGIGAFAQAVEPAATLAVGVFAGVLVFAMLSPITSIMDKLH